MSPSEFQRGFGTEEPEFAAGSVFGIRSYRVGTGNGTSLFTLSGQVCSWASKEMTAGCITIGTSGLDSLPYKHSSPDPQCTCGIYAYWSVDQLPNPNGLLAVVEGYGKVLIGPKGYRAEKARIVGFTYTPVPNLFFDIQSTGNVVNGVSVRYGIPSYFSKGALLKAHPLTTDYYVPDTPEEIANKREALSKKFATVSDNLEKMTDSLAKLVKKIKDLNSKEE